MKRRVRASIACTECRRKKIRCDTGEPKCKHCINSNSECIYNVPRKPAAPNPRRNRLDISTRLSRIERMLERVLADANGELPGLTAEQLNAGPSDSSDDEEPVGDDPVNATDVMSARFYPSLADDPIYSHGLSCVVLSKRFMDKMEKYIGDETRFVRLRNAFAAFSTCISSRTIDKVPFFDVSNPSTPIDPSNLAYVQQILKEEPRFLHSILTNYEEFQAAQRPHVETYGPYSGTCIIYYAIIATALVERVPRSELLLSNASPHPLVKQACIAYSHAIHATINSSVFRPNFSVLKGILALYACPLTITLPASVEVFFSRRCMEICADLGLNRRSFYTNLDEKDRRLYSSLFWYTYCFNRTTSLRIGCPTVMSFSQISVDLPENTPKNSETAFLRPAVELFKLYDFIYDRLCSVSAERRSLRQLIRDIMTCDQKLGEWFNSLEPWMQVASDSPVTDPEIEPVLRDRILRVHCAYHYLTICVHRMTALVPVSIQRQLRSMFPSALHEITASQNGKSDSATTPPDFLSDELNPSEVKHGVSRVLNSLQICAGAARKILQLDIAHTNKPASSIVTTGRAYDFLNTCSTLFIKSAFRADAESTEDAKLLRQTSEVIAQNVHDPNQLCKHMQELLQASADVIDCMVIKSSEAQAVKQEKSYADYPNHGPAWPETPNGGFEGLAAELFPEFGFPSPSNIFMSGL